MNFSKDTENAQVYVLRIWDQNMLQDAVCLDPKGDLNLLIDCVERQSMVLTRESLLI